MSQQLDTQGEAHEALGTAVASYGQRVLNDPHTLGNLVADLLPDLPRERSLLVTAAEAGIAAEMRQHVEDQHVDPDTAAQLVARALSERRAIDPAASLWVASEYAQALGYQVRPYTAAIPPGQPQQVSTAVPSAMTAATSPPATEAPTVQVPIPESWPPAGPVPQRPPGQFWQPPPQPLPTPQSWPPAGPPPGQSWPPPQPSSGDPENSWSGRKRGLIATAAAVTLIGGYLIAAAFAHTFPFTKSRPVAASSPARSARPTPKPTPTATGPRLAAGVAPLIQLLPGDIDDPATQCQPDPPPYGFDMRGRVEALTCTDPGLPKGSHVYAYQLDNHADYEATWQSFNKVIGFTSANAGPNCPPAKGGMGTAPMHARWFPPRSGQLLECVTVRDNNGPPQPVYTWTLPTEDAFLVAVGPPNSSFAALDSWFASASMPLASPSPSAS